MAKANDYRNRHRHKAITKFSVCQSKMENTISERENNLIPEDIWDIVKDVSVFKGAVEPEQPADPMVCDQSIKLSRCEMAFLRKGPKYMLRGELDEQEFKVDMHKMIIKEKYDKSGEYDDECERSITS